MELEVQISATNDKNFSTASAQLAVQQHGQWLYHICAAVWRTRCNLHDIDS